MTQENSLRVNLSSNWPWKKGKNKQMLLLWKENFYKRLQVAEETLIDTASACAIFRFGQPIKVVN